MADRKRTRGEGTVRDHKGGLKKARLYVPKERISFYGPTEAAALKKKKNSRRTSRRDSPWSLAS